MRKEELRQRDILKLIEGLDISPTMYKNATEKYKAVGTYMQEQGLVCDIFPQGSFSLGTVVRPYRESKEVDYDLDFICCIDEQKGMTTAKEIKNVVKETLCKSEIYKDKLQDKEWDKCWTLEYADVNGIGFNIDIVPGVPESQEVIGSMMTKGLTLEEAELAVAITNKRENNYLWITSNSRAYKNWFEAINRPYFEYDRSNRRKVLFEKSKTIYSSIEEIPEGLERSSLQRVIQILKHHRDVYYCRIGKEKLKPTSAVITTICAEIAMDLSSHLNVFELLQGIANEFEIYSQNQRMEESAFSAKYQNKNIIRKNSGKWYILNPVNPEDNLADSWNDDPQKVDLFFRWVKAMKRDYLESLQIEDNDFVALLENNFGGEYVKKRIDLKDYANTAPKVIVNTPKPWRR